MWLVGDGFLNSNSKIVAQNMLKNKDETPRQNIARYKHIEEGNQQRRLGDRKSHTWSIPTCVGLAHEPGIQIFGHGGDAEEGHGELPGAVGRLLSGLFGRTSSACRSSGKIAHFLNTGVFCKSVKGMQQLQ